MEPKAPAGQGPPLDKAPLDKAPAGQGPAGQGPPLDKARVRDLEGGWVDTACYSSEVTTLPYNNPDPRHPNISRATFKAQILVRMRGEENA